MTLSNDLTWKRHVDNIVKKAGKIIYMLYQLKRAGVNQADLVTIVVCRHGMTPPHMRKGRLCDL